MLSLSVITIGADMRLWAMLLLLSASCACCAQQDALALCLAGLVDDPRFGLIAGKVAVGDFSDPTFAMLADRSTASTKEKQAISQWAAARSECVKAEARYGNALYRPPIQAFRIEAENGAIAAAVDLYDRKTTFGEFNRQLRAIAGDLRAKIAALGLQIREQWLAQGQADQQAREMAQMQKNLDEVQRQASLAQQQALQAQQEAAGRFTAASNQTYQTYRTYRTRRPPYLPLLPNQTCYQFGSRVICTFR